MFSAETTSHEFHLNITRGIVKVCLCAINTISSSVLLVTSSNSVKYFKL